MGVRWALDSRRGGGGECALYTCTYTNARVRTSVQAMTGRSKTAWQMAQIRESSTWMCGCARWRGWVGWLVKARCRTAGKHEGARSIPPPYGA